MRTRTLKRLLSVTTLLLFIGACVAVILGVNLPIDMPDIQEHDTAKPAVKVSRIDTHQVPELASLQRLARQDLRQRLFDPPPKPKVVVPPKPPPTILLLGTIVNAANPQAMIVGFGGKTELKRIGDTVGDPSNPAVIREILPDHIQVEHEGNTLDIAIAKDGGRRQ